MSRLVRYLIVTHDHNAFSDKASSAQAAVASLVSGKGAVQLSDTLDFDVLLRVHKSRDGVLKWIAAGWDVCVLLESDEGLLNKRQTEISTKFLQAGRNVYVLRNRELRKVTAVMNLFGSNGTERVVSISESKWARIIVTQDETPASG